MTNRNELNRLDRFAAFMTRHRSTVLGIVLAITLVFLYGARNIKGDVILQDLFPYDHPYLKLHARFSKVFGSGGSGVVIALKAKNADIFNQHTLDKLKEMTEEVMLWDEVYQVLTVSIAGRPVKVVKALGAGEIRIVPLMWPDVPETSKDIADVKKNIFSSPAYNGTLVSKDGTAAIIITEFKENISYERTHRLLRKLVRDYADERTSIHVVGFPSLMGWIYSLKPQMKWVFAASIGLIVLMLYLISRNLAGMIAPMSIGLISAIIGLLGFVGWTGINFSPLMYVLAFLVGARKISHSLQISHRYFEELNESDGDKEKACHETMRAMIIPNLTGVITDAAGFFVLILAKIVLMQQIAIIMTFWMLSIAFSAILTPIICTFIPRTEAGDRWSKKRKTMSFLDRMCMASARFSIKSGKYMVGAGCIMVVLLSVYQMKNLKIGDPSPGSPLLWPDHRYNRDQAIVDRSFDASSENLVLYYEGEPASVYDPIVLKTFAAFDRHMKASLPDIYKSSNSIIDYLRMVNETLHDGDPAWYQLPREENLLTGIMGWMRTSVDLSTMRRYLDPGMKSAQITLYFSDHTSKNLLRIRDAANEFFKTHPREIQKGRFRLAGGRIGMELAVNEEMKRSHLVIGLMVLTCIFFMCSLAFRSFVAGLMLALPLLIANMIAFCYMAMTNIGLSINTLPVAAVGVGVGVDFAIYVYSRVIEEFPRHDDWIETILMAIRTSGKAVVYTGLTLILAIIPWYFISELKFQAQMGFFLSMLLLTNVILSITLHPLLIVKIKPRFIARGRAFH